MKNYYIQAYTQPEDCEFSYELGYLATGENLIEALNAFKEHYKSEFAVPISCHITKIIMVSEIEEL